MKRILSVSAIAAALFAAVAFTPVQSAFAQNAPQAQSTAPNAADQDAAKQLDELKAQLKKQVGDAVAALNTPDAQKAKAQLDTDAAALAQLKQDYAKAKAANGDVKAIEAKYAATINDTIKHLQAFEALVSDAAHPIGTTMMGMQIVALVGGPQIDKAELETIVKPLSDAANAGEAAAKAVTPVMKATRAGLLARKQSGEKLTAKAVDEELGKAAAADLAAQ